MLVLVVPTSNTALSREIAWLGWHAEPFANGYARVLGSVYTLYIVELDPLSESEDKLRPYTQSGKVDAEIARRMLSWINEVAKMQDIQRLEGFQELLGRLLDAIDLEQVLDHYAPEQVLDHYAPRERLAGLTPEQVLDALPEETRQHLLALVAKRG